MSDGLGSSHTEQVGLIDCDSYKDRQKQKGERSCQETPGEDGHLHHGTEAIPEDSFILCFFQRPETAFLIFKPPGAWSPRNAHHTADAWAGERLGTGGRKAL